MGVHIIVELGETGKKINVSQLPEVFKHQKEVIDSNFAATSTHLPSLE